jgi:hypothetical protein
MMGMGALGGAFGEGEGGVAAGLGMGGAGDWETHYNDAGPYCFNSRTQVSQWDPPMEMAMQLTLGSMMGAAAAPSPGMARGMPSGFSRGPASSLASIGGGGAHPVVSFLGCPRWCHFGRSPHLTAHTLPTARQWASAACLQCECSNPEFTHVKVR